MCKKFLFAVMTIAFMLTPAYAGPFGTNMGDPKEKFAPYDVISESVVVSKNVPQKHDAFERYVIVSSEKYGLVRIVAASGIIYNDSFGISARRKFGEIASQLDSKYSEGEMFDFLYEGSVFGEEKYWAFSIVKNERAYVKKWNPSKNTDNIKSIILEVKGATEDSVEIYLNYTYTNFDKYLETIKRQSFDSL